MSAPAARPGKRTVRGFASVALMLLAAQGCGGSEPEAAATAVDAQWPRPNAAPTDDEAWLFFAVLGEFPDVRPEFPQADYRSAGAVRGFEVRTFRGAQLEQLVDGWTTGPVGEALAQNDPELLDAIHAAPECLALDVRVPDAPHCDHLRNAIGLVTWFTDLGGAAVIDPQALQAWRPAAWRAECFEPAERALRAQVALVWSADDGAQTPRSVASAPPALGGGATFWIRSRGLRKFARPDVSLRAVPAERFDAAVRFLETLVAAQIDGAVLPTGDAVDLPGQATPVRCQLTGDLDDPDFINVHLALEW